MIWEALAICLVIVPAFIATILQANCWPYEPFSMFSTVVDAESLRVLRVAYEDKQGNVHWWRPHYHRLGEMFGQEAKAIPNPSVHYYHDPTQILFSRIERCMADDPNAVEISGICLFVRYCQKGQDGDWHVRDVLVIRRSL